MPKLILIVDDVEVIRKATRDFIEANTLFQVCGEAVDGLDAVEMARELKPDLIILDLSMPRMNGLQAARLIRMTSEVPIILFTLHASVIRTQDTVSFGINAVISKADGLAILAEQVGKLLTVMGTEPLISPAAAA